ncbi:DUF2787 domain-containing protein [Photobacterium damselae subsp. damselae]|uniref:DUF2787 domain-containing protein n=1 Tax=Photobacterium damselae TaxID=38293 RepID=UPI001594A185|nr:DUF2787 domain-containing protein [Photobacterium damselae]NVH52900.1 DUF2787 domain-containing protein [Photobacterium damselae subsp. damselae]NVO80920.1 DUF2787 domain-containing protein [Photobacterium damselae subsp. damselae]
MHLTFSVERLLLPVTVDLQQKLQHIATQYNLPTTSTSALTFNFRDTRYSAESGGWHPVEIRIEQENGQWHFSYITDFSYVGYPYPELAKEVDFDFDNNRVSVLYSWEELITDSRVIELYQMWERNFVAYVEMEVFDEIKVTAENQ